MSKRRRNEFSAKTKRQAYSHANGKCQKCGIAFDGIKIKPEYDHIIMDALSGNNSLANCQVLCRKCHDEKTSKRDIPTIAKVKRLNDEQIGIKHKNNLKRGKAKQLQKSEKTTPPRRGGIAAQFGLVSGS